MTSHRDAQTIVREAVQARLRRTLRELAANELDTDQVFARIAREIRARLGATQYAEAEVERLVREAFERALGERQDGIERSIRAAAEEARQADGDAVRRIFGEAMEGAPGAGPFEASRPSGRPRLSLVPPPASEDSSPEID